MKLFNFFKKGKSNKNDETPNKELSQEEPKTEKKLIQIWKPRPVNIEKFFPGDEIIVSKTDKRGNIIYGNALFVYMAGYTESEILGQPHNIIRHPDMPQLIFKALWDALAQGKEINAFVVNLSKDGRYYWVFANVTPSFDEEGNIIAYHSVRRKPNPKALAIIIPFYRALKKMESFGGMHESEKELVKVLESKGMSYEEFVLHLQYNNI